jgi:hypothetical protein
MVRKFVAVLVGLVLAGASVSAAQDAAKREFGVDLGFVYHSPDGGDSYFTIGTPVDVRVGFVSGEKLTFEPRVAFSYISDVLGDAAYTADLGLNVTYGMQSNRNGLYLTAGASTVLIGALGETASTFGFNGGIGTRSGMLRAEAFGAYLMENTDKGIPADTQFGVRLGLSFWK